MAAGSSSRCERNCDCTSGRFATNSARIPTAAEMVPADGDLGLDGDDAPEAVLVGTSYSADALWGFDGALMHRLGLGVDNRALEGLGPVVPMMRYLADPAAAAPPPLLVVWEIPARQLALPPAAPAGAPVDACRARRGAER